MFDQGERKEGDIAQDSHDAQWHHRLHVERGESEKRCHPGGELPGGHGRASLSIKSRVATGNPRTVEPGLPDYSLLGCNLYRFEVSGKPYGGGSTVSLRT